MGCSARRGPKKVPTFLPPSVFPMASPFVGLFSRNFLPLLTSFQPCVQKEADAEKMAVKLMKV